MILFPAIDLKEGACVRLVQGHMDQATVFNDDPAAQARAFEAQGFEWLHLVDLNGAFEGEPVNGPAIEKIIGAVSLPVQLGGGIRSMPVADYWFSKGVTRLIIGTAAVRDPHFVRAACRAYPGRIAVGLDAREGRVAVNGWSEDTDLSVTDIASRFEDAGVAAIIFTDIARDGVLTGVNVEATVDLAEAVSIPVIASGGVSSLADIKRLLDANCPGIEGVISGRALYDGRLDPAAALKLLKERAHA